MGNMVYGWPDFRAGQGFSRRRWLGKLMQWVLPARCIACGNNASWGNASAPLDLCPACCALLPLNRLACRGCAIPLPTTHTELLCGRCLVKPPRYQASFCAYQYGYPLQHLIRHLKYHAALPHAQVLGSLLASYLIERHTESWPDCFVPVPLHSARYRSRGYNQVIELGRYVERGLQLEMRTDLVARKRNTVEQAGLSRRARRSNLRRAFFVTSTILPKHIALLDDVITTGSTVNELSRVFKKAGAERIEVWGLARAVVGNRSAL
jgi:ComF family protein